MGVTLDMVYTQGEKAGEASGFGGKNMMEAMIGQGGTAVKEGDRAGPIADESGT